MNAYHPTRARKRLRTRADDAKRPIFVARPLFAEFDRQTMLELASDSIITGHIACDVEIINPGPHRFRSRIRTRP